MERSKKHIIPKDRYRRKRRVFEEGSPAASENARGQEPLSVDANDQAVSSDSREELTPEMADERAAESSPETAEEADVQDAVGEDAAENTGAERRRAIEARDESREFGPGEEGYKDRSAPAALGGGASFAAGSTPRADRASAGRGGGNDEGGRRRGCLGSFFIPFLAALLGALLMFLLINAFGDDGGNTADDGTQDNGETNEQGITEETEEEAADRPETETTAAVQEARPSVVSIVNLQRMSSIVPGLPEVPDSGGGEPNPEEAGTGSGVIYKLTDDYAYIVTNEHVVSGAQEIQVNMENGDQLSAELIGSDLWTDLAVLRVERGNIDQAIEFGDSDNLLVGETAIAIGSPLGEAFSGSVSQGIISGLDRSVPVDIDGDGNYDWEANVIQTDAAINPGNSGGALVDQNGSLIGINSMKISMPMVEGIGFAIPANDVQRIVQQLEENGEVQRPYLGVLLQDLYTVPAEVLVNEMNLPDDVDSGVIISHVESGTPADDAGLEELDLVVALDGNEVQNMMELRQYLYYDKQQGEQMEIEYYRNGELQTTTATLE